jgi:glyoxylase-like metal-dependent hydrolase (beta-lactamase superfamily II)
MQWQIGNVKITRIEELMGPLFDPASFFPDFDPNHFEEHRDWLFPDHVDAKTGRIIASMHSWLIETSHHKILVDTCIGNNKQRMPYRDWHEMNTPWLQNLAQAGVSPDEIDFVMCTHLHVDHVGWNTQLKDGQWVPTFPNAKYIFSKVEHDFWLQQRHKNSSESFAAVNNQTFDDSITPIMHLAELIEGDTELIADLLNIKPAPGHTPGSITIEVQDKGELGIFTGDICHHPIQVAEPELNSAYCELPDAARKTRRNVLERCCGESALMLPAHFGPGFAGHIRASGKGFRIDF